jgi:hypothetical protein
MVTEEGVQVRMRPRPKARLDPGKDPLELYEFAI